MPYEHIMTFEEWMLAPENCPLCGHSYTYDHDISLVKSNNSFNWFSTKRRVICRSKEEEVPYAA